MTPSRSSDVIVVAGAAGDLGGRITRSLLTRGATVRALVRPGAPTTSTRQLADLGATLTPADPGDETALTEALAGAGVVVSSLNGLREVIVDRQSVLLQAAGRAGVPRFFSSDFSADFTRTTPGRNRNFDLRREFMARADRSPLQVTSILNGAFMDMLGAEMPIIQPSIRRVLHVGDVEQPLDFTTKDDTADYTADAALDPSTPRVLRIAGDTVSARDLSRIMSELSGRPYRTLRVGGTGTLSGLIRLTQTLAPQRDSVFPAWQGMQYLRDMFSGQARLLPLDNDRYPLRTWTGLADQLARSTTLRTSNG